MRTETHKQTPKVKAFVAGTDGARKRDFRFSVTNHPQFHTASYWSGGSRDYFTVINMITGERITPPVGTFPAFVAHYTLNPGEILMQVGLCCGKPFAPYFHCLAADENRARVFLGLPMKLSGDSVVIPIERETEVITVDTGAKILA